MHMQGRCEVSVEHRRCLLHRKDAEAFRTWLAGEGWVLVAGHGIYDAIRARKDGKWFIAYDRNRGDHLSVQADMQNIVRQFLATKGTVCGAKE